MEEKKLTRREAMARLTRIIAMASGLSISHVRFLFGLEKTPALQKQKSTTTKPTLQKVPTAEPAKLKPVRKTPNLQKLKGVKPSNKAVKILKVLVHNERSVFENEFGRVTPKHTVKDVARIPGNYRRFLTGFDVRPGMIVCPVEWIGPGDFLKCDVGLFCGTNFRAGGMVAGKDCNDNCHLGCGGESKLVCKNKCSPQTSCGPNNYQEWPTEYTNAGFFDRYRTDPYIQALFREFNVRTSQELSQEVQTMIMHRRRGLGR